MTGRDDLPRHTTPTWESELLISGATVFALLQLPGVLDEAFYAYFPRFQRPLAEMVMLPYLYGKTAVYALILTFVLHLSMRAYWVGLVGLRSVYGDGVRWEKLRWGPAYLRVLRARTPPIDALVERADNRASLVFSYGVAFALVTLTPIGLVAIVAFATWLFHVATNGFFPWQRTWLVMLVATMVPLFAGMSFDRFFGKRLRPEGLASRALSAMFRLYQRVGMASASSYAMLVFVSRAGPKRAGVLLTFAILAMFGFTFLQLAAREGDVDVGSYGELALGQAGAARVLRNEYYADSRSTDLSTAAPFIPHRVVRGDWLELFIPFRPGRDSVGLQSDCPPVAAPPAEDGEHEEIRERVATDAARARVLDCLARIYAPAIDGVPVAQLRLDAADDPRSGLRGAVAMLPLHGLAPGRHELTVNRLRKQLADADAPAPAPHRIVFWR